MHRLAFGLIPSYTLSVPFLFTASALSELCTLHSGGIYCANMPTASYFHISHITLHMYSLFSAHALFTPCLFADHPQTLSSGFCIQAISGIRRGTLSRTHLGMTSIHRCCYQIYLDATGLRLITCHCVHSQGGTAPVVFSYVAVTL
jgi:hypothetical protein